MKLLYVYVAKSGYPILKCHTGIRDFFHHKGVIPSIPHDVSPYFINVNVKVCLSSGPCTQKRVIRVLIDILAHNIPLLLADLRCPQS